MPTGPPPRRPSQLPSASPRLAAYSHAYRLTAYSHAYRLTAYSLIASPYSHADSLPYS